MNQQQLSSQQSQAIMAQWLLSDIANQVATLGGILLAMYGLRELAKRMAKGLGW